MLKICTYFFTFMIYSVFGWVIETLLYAVKNKKIVKRGFLFGPLCPIYGTGAVICTLILYGRINNIFLLFLAGAGLCGALEYITHFLMEKLFHAMWWDYSGRRFNLKGRIYLNGVISFGLGVVLIIKLFQPLVFKLISLINPTVLYIICFFMYSLLLIDIATTIADLKGSIKVLKKIQYMAITNGQKRINDTDEKIAEWIDEIKETEVIRELISLIKNDKSVFSRIKKRYPNFTLSKYKKLLDVILDKPQESKARTDIKLYGSDNDIREEDIL